MTGIAAVAEALLRRPMTIEAPQPALRTWQAAQALARLMAGQRQLALRRLLDRIDAEQLGSLSRTDLLRLCTLIWIDPAVAERVPALLDHCTTLALADIDQCLAAAYWRHFQAEDARFDQLAAYLRANTQRLGSPWRELNDAFMVHAGSESLDRVGMALLRLPEGHRKLRDLGLRTRDLRGGYVEAAIAAALRRVAANPDPRGDESLPGCEAVIHALCQLDPALTRRHAGLVVHALLAPWMGKRTPDAVQARLCGFLIDRFGDPRTDARRWQALRDEAQRTFGEAAAGSFALLMQWLARATVSRFFDVVARNDFTPGLLAERRAFWLSYAVAGQIDEAWCILGTDFSPQRRSELGEPAGEVSGSGVPAGHSVLLMRIGALVVAEWTPTASARLWLRPDAPPFFERSYVTRSLCCPAQAAWHNPITGVSHQGNWYRVFAEDIAAKTGVAYTGPRPPNRWG